MSDSLVFLLNRADELLVIDPDLVPHHDDPNPLMEIAAAVINAGFRGVAVDEIRLSNGRYFQALEVMPETPEGSILQHLQHSMDSGGVLPTPDAVVAAIRQHYDRTADGPNTSA